MKRSVDLPLDRLERMQTEIWSELNQSDAGAAKEAYARLVANISNPVSSQLVRVVRGSKWLQVSLDAIILWRRASWVLYTATVLLTVLVNWWFLVLIPLVWVANNIGLNHLQTVLNVALAARLSLLNVLTEEDPAFRDRVFGPIGGEAMPQKPQRESSSVTEEAAIAMCGAAMALHNQVETTLCGQKIQKRESVEFRSELLCYFLHMLDRELSKSAPPRVRTEALDSLIRVLCKHQYKLLYELGLDMTEEQVFGIFQDRYNDRQLEYGSFGQDWFQKVAVRFGQHAADALETPEDIQYEVAVKCCLFAPAAYTDLSSVLQPFLESAWKRSHERLT